MDVRYAGVGKQFQQVAALVDLNLTVPDGTFLVLLGPSGCGKTTALRIAAGLEQPTSGRLLLGGQDVTEVPPRRRDVAMVFQSYALYPHLTVGENIAYPLRVRKVPKPERAGQAQRVADLLDIGTLLDRKPRQLSGGQRQRVALARAIIRQPSVFLMDEPLSNLDAQLRTQMRAELKHLQRQLAVTTLYVTHDQVEAMTMADQVAVLRHGRLQQLATPQQLYARPANLFVATFCGSPPMNVLAGELADGRFTRPEGAIEARTPAGRGPVKLGFRPEHARLAAAGAPGSLPAEVYAVEPLGNETLVALRLGEDLVTVRTPAGTRAATGDRCGVLLDPAHLHFFDPETELARAADAPLSQVQP
jgi:multiple sugar transport system ATP-binding protein